MSKNFWLNFAIFALFIYGFDYYVIVWLFWVYPILNSLQIKALNDLIIIHVIDINRIIAEIDSKLTIKLSPIK
jgi:hypothetical protein